MLKNLSFFTLAGALALTTACIVSVTDDATTSSNDDTTTTMPGDGDPGDGDGDPGDGDPGDGDPGDGDGDPGDGDGDPGDGDPGDGDPGDGDGDPAGGLCGWVEAESYYDCGGMGEDPAMTNPIACPEGLVAGEACDSTEPALTGVGCCAGDVVYYCTQEGTIAEFDCNDA